MISVVQEAIVSLMVDDVVIGWLGDLGERGSKSFFMGIEIKYYVLTPCRKIIRRAGSVGCEMVAWSTKARTAKENHGPLKMGYEVIQIIKGKA